ncbi:MULTISPECIES: chaplin [unclassified Streptomyces]|uniref:chaplin n=1 Tax=unclassified Streptomyces TaxID=2593676 RepID=UPI00201F5BD7|nr:chaplin [Streptomyces sp. 35G-GA-8]MCL7380783.1 chaplin [Streptomyces sp. 35G-GA-8]
MKCKKAATVVAGLLLAMGSAAPAMADAEAEGVAAHSPGVLSGNVVQVPVNIPVNVCGNSIDVIGLLNPAFGNKCINK